MRDGWYYLQLGFEHGYEGAESSYPDEAKYREGRDLGIAFRSRVLHLVPTLDRDIRGDLFVSFRYVLRAAGEGEVGDERRPSRSRRRGL
jgi:hypothetical protein